MTTITLKNNLPAVRISNDTHTCEIYQHGAHVSSWRVNSTGEELLFCSTEAIFDGSKAIRGGIPICFPQFSDLGPCDAQHGFARNSHWDVKALSATEVTLQLESSAVSAKLSKGFSGTYALEYIVTLDGERLRTTLRVQNISKDTSMEFTTALHTYFAVEECTRSVVRGLLGTTYLDNLQQRIAKLDEDECVRFNGEVDRIYKSTADVLVIEDEARGRKFKIEKTLTLPDAVVWNPWIEKAAKMGDFGNEEYHSMVCVEVANVQGAVVPAGGSWEASQLISCVLS